MQSLCCYNHVDPENETRHKYDSEEENYLVLSGVMYLIIVMFNLV